MEPHIQSAFYDRVWSIGHVWSHTAWPEWSIIAPHIAASPRRLEIGAGLRPRLPMRGTLFADVSAVALDKLRSEGGLPIRASADNLPLPNRSLDMVAACELLEHIPDDAAAFAEIARVLRDGGWFFFSVPLHAALWTDHDVMAGHYRRYEVDTLAQILEHYGFSVMCFSPGISSGYAPFKRIGAAFFGHFPRSAIWFEDRLIMPLGARFQRGIRRYETTIPQDTSAPSAFIACRKR